MGAHPRRRGRLPFVLLLLTTLTVAACGGGNDDSPKDVVAADAGIDALVTAAKAEGKITIYSAQGLDPLNDLAAEFEAEYPGIDVEAVRGVDGDLGAEGRDRAPDRQGHRRHVRQRQPELGADARRTRAAGSSSADGPGADGRRATTTPTQYVHEGNYFEVGAALLTFGWNTDLFDGKGLDDYPDLLDPELKGGKIGVIEPTAPSIVDFYLWLEETYGEDYVEKLAAQEPRIYPSAAADGRGAGLRRDRRGHASWRRQLSRQKAKGAPVDFAMPPRAPGAPGTSA